MSGRRPTQRPRFAPTSWLLATLAAPLCASFAGCAHEEICDWEDNDHDGIIDEGFDADGDGWWACGINAQQAALGLADCDDSDAGVNPDADERCDGRDDNCDGVTDDGCAPLVAQLGVPVTQVEVEERGDGSRWLVALGGVRKDAAQELLMAEEEGDGAWRPHPIQSVQNWGLFAVAPLDSEGVGSMDLLGLGSSGVAPLHAAGDGQVVGVVEEWRYLWADAEDKPFMIQPTDLSVGPLAGWPSPAVIITGNIRPQGVTTYLLDLASLEVINTFAWPDVDGGSADYARADLDGDGQPELIAARGATLLTRSFTADGAGGPRSYTLEDAIGRLSTGDVDGDGGVDVVATVPNRWRVYLLRNDGEGGLLEPEEIPQPLRHPLFSALLDIDGDGDLDLALNDPDDAWIQLLRGDGRGAFREACVAPTAADVRLIRPLRTWDGHVGLLTGHGDGSVHLVAEPCGP